MAEHRFASNIKKSHDQGGLSLVRQCQFYRLFLGVIGGHNQRVNEWRLEMMSMSADLVDRAPRSV